MSDIMLLRDAFNHMHWADAKMYNRLLKMPALQKDERVMELLQHVHTVQYAFYYLWTGEPLRFPEKGDFKDLPALAGWASRYYPPARDFLAVMKEGDFGRRIHVPWSDYVEKQKGRKAQDATLPETIWQVAAHTTHHRAQVNTLIRAAGGQPPLVDFIAWVWEGKPEAIWPDFSKEWVTTR